MEPHEHLSILGHRVQDRVTGLKGVVTSVCFDLYGCIQCVVDPGVDKDGKRGDSHYYDKSRLEVQSKKPVIPPPRYSEQDFSAGEHGSADKPAPR